MKVDHLVVDSGGFLRNADLKELGTKIYTCREVVTEIKDRVTRRRLAVLPYELNFKEPSSSSIQKVIEASKKSGDYASLSSVDIKVLALTYELTVQHKGADDIKDNIENNCTVQLGGDLQSDMKLPGFFLPDAQQENSEEVQLVDETAHIVICPEQLAKDIEEINLNEEKSLEEVINSDLKDSSCLDADGFSDKALCPKTGDDEDNGGWITPAMLREMKSEQVLEYKKVIQVACLTTDFAMQNVLLKMNINIVSVDGMLVKTMRSYVLRCHSCFEVTKIMTKVFCPKCGNKTLKRVPVEVQEDGSMKMFFSRNPKVLNPRGSRYSLPMPQGGKHSRNPILCEDQVVPQDRPSRKALVKTDVWNEDYDNATSPFIMNDTESRAFRLGVRPGNSRKQRRNPNAVGKKFVKQR
ncbi:RNA-binding protein NOB1-like [Clavelina lepadiformis]|uniref:RNA-binding protein NOB1-like n=1 Tax=Clavelina lepadiformis TaxID=159417 RepID=UPI004042319B